MTLVDKQSLYLKEQINPIIEQLVDLTNSIDQADMHQTAKDLLNAVNDPYMFVIVGEVKAGKSSFINALLSSKEEICKVAPSPMTDKIQQIVYGEKEEEFDINDHIRRISKNIEILQNIAIVDTPGTNTIIAHHQELTESFIPSSDLIVFVFESKNPYRQSAWDFFDYINNEWHKKIIFVLQQKDLLSAEDLQVNVEGVRKYAIQKGITDPLIFAVSALEEQNGNLEKSGYLKLRDYIRSNITGSIATQRKFLNLSQTSLNLTEKIKSGVETRLRQLEEDRNFRKNIQQGLDHQQEKANRYTRMLSENIIACYNTVMLDQKNELKQNIGFLSLLRRSVNSIFKSESSIKSWLEDFSKETETKLNKEFSKRLDEGVDDITESIQDMAKNVDLKIRQSKTVLKDDHEIFSDIAEKRHSVLKDLNAKFKNFLESAESFYPDNIDNKTKSLLPDMATGSGIAIIGMILTGITNAAVFDITGGIITALGLGFAGISLGINRNSILKSYDQSIEKGKQRIETDLTESLRNYTQRIKDKINDNFYKFDEYLSHEAEETDKLMHQTQIIVDRLSIIKVDIQKTMS